MVCPEGPQISVHESVLGGMAQTPVLLHTLHAIVHSSYYMFHSHYIYIHLLCKGYDITQNKQKQTGKWIRNSLKNGFDIKCV